MKTRIIPIDPKHPEQDKISQCARIIRQGGLVIFPTETVYGIAACLENKQAMKRLREVKKRSEEKPFSILISQRSQIFEMTSCENPMLYKLIDRFWPGPLTVIVPSRDERQTWGVRMPDHAVALDLIEQAGCMIAAPSATVRMQLCSSSTSHAFRGCKKYSI